MTPNDYQQAALRTAPKDLPPDGFDAEHSLHRNKDDI